MGSTSRSAHRRRVVAADPLRALRRRHGRAPRRAPGPPRADPGRSPTSSPRRTSSTRCASSRSRCAGGRACRDRPRGPTHRATGGGGEAASARGPRASRRAGWWTPPRCTSSWRSGPAPASVGCCASCPRALATSPAWATVIDPAARVALRGVRTRGVARAGRREYYGAVDAHAVTSLEGRLDGIRLGHLAPVDPPCRFGFSSTRGAVGDRRRDDHRRHRPSRRVSPRYRRGRLRHPARRPAIRCEG